MIYLARQIGLRDLHVALLLTDAVGVPATYAVPVKLERAIKASLKPKVTQDKLYSDDALEEILNTFDSVEVSIELNQLTLASRALIQGANVVKGVLIESKDDIPPELALGFKSKKTNGKYRYVWLYKGSFSLGDDTYEGIAEKPKDQTASLSAIFYARESDNLYRLIADEDEVGIEPATITGWFTEVPVPPTEV